MTGLLRAELLRLRAGRTLVGLALAAVLLNGISIFGTASTAGKTLVAGGQTATGLTQDLVRLGFATLLFAMLLGVLTITGELRHGSIMRSALLARGMRRLLAAKAIATAAVGIGLGLFGALAAVLTARLAIRGSAKSRSWVCRGVTRR